MKVDWIISEFNPIILAFIQRAASVIWIPRKSTPNFGPKKIISIRCHKTLGFLMLSVCLLQTADLSKKNKNSPKNDYLFFWDTTDSLGTFFMYKRAKNVYSHILECNHICAIKIDHFTFIVCNVEFLDKPAFCPKSFPSILAERFLCTLLDMIYRNGVTSIANIEFGAKSRWSLENNPKNYWQEVLD